MLPKVAFLATIATLAQVSEGTPALYTYGPLGIITCWLMYRDEMRAKQVTKMEAQMSEMHVDAMHRIDGLAKALLMDMVERESAGDHVREYATEAIRKIDAREARDSTKKK